MYDCTHLLRQDRFDHLFGDVVQTPLVLFALLFALALDATLLVLQRPEPFDQRLLHLADALEKKNDKTHATVQQT